MDSGLGAGGAAAMGAAATEGAVSKWRWLAVLCGASGMLASLPVIAALLVAVMLGFGPALAEVFAGDAVIWALTAYELGAAASGLIAMIVAQRRGKADWTAWGIYGGAFAGAWIWGGIVASVFVAAVALFAQAAG